MAKKKTLWPITRATQAKHTILRKYLDAWLPILGAGRYAHDHLVLIDGFAGTGRYSGGEPGSPLIMLSAFLEHSANLDADAHFFFIEEDRARCEHLRSEIGKVTLPANVQVEIIEGSFVDEFPQLLERLTRQFGQLPPTFAFIDGSGRRSPLHLDRIDWLIVGGESGPDARPLDLAWALELAAA